MSERKKPSGLSQREIAKAMAAGANITQAEARAALDMAFQVIAEEVPKGRWLNMPGLGKLLIKPIAPKTYFAGTANEISKGFRNKIYFRPFKEVKAILSDDTKTFVNRERAQ